ncbi:MAG: hypothetical protein ACHQ2Z_13720 [Elusimicrobiota bacterium]
MRPGPRAWLFLALLAGLGRAAFGGAAAADEAALARLPDTAGSIPLAAPAPITQFSALALSPSFAAPAALVPIAQPDIPLALPAAAVEERASAPEPGSALRPRSEVPDGDAASAPAGAGKLFDGGVEAPDAVFQERQRAVRAAATFKFSTGPRGRSVLDWRKNTIDGLPAEEINGFGQANAGVLRYVRDGSRRVLKVLTQTIEEDYPEDYPDYPAEVQLRAGAVGAVFGAPRILRTGTIRNGPYENYFIEMEERFSGEHSRGFKDALNSPGKEAWVKSLSRPARSGEAPVARIARMIVEVMEHGVVPYDGDFLVAEDGRVSWIDANFWAIDENAGFPKHRAKLLRETNYFLRSFAADPATGRIFMREFLAALKHSRRIPGKIKDAVLENWVERDSASLEAVGISGPTMLRAFYDGLP